MRNNTTTILGLLKLFFFFSFLLSSAGLKSQGLELQEHWWQPDGSVKTIVEDNGIVYIGGDFTEIGPYQPFGTQIDSATGFPDFSRARPSGAVLTSTSDGNGGWYIGGQFNMVGDSVRGRLAHINAMGEVTAWSPGAGIGYVYSIEVSDSTVYVGGTFTTINGQSRNNIAAIDVNSGIATAWNPNINGTVRTIKVDGDTVYVGGQFNTIGGQTRYNIAAIDASTGNVTAWNPSANSYVYSIEVSGSTVYAGGDFAIMGGNYRSRIAAIDASTGSVTAWNPNAGSIVNSIVVSDSIVYAGGEFTSIGGLSRNRIAAIHATTGAPTSWNPNANNHVKSIAVSGSNIYLGGEFTSIGGLSRNRIAAIDATTGAPTAWNPNSNSHIFSIAVFGNKVYAGGYFSNIAVQSRNKIAAIDAATGVVTAWNPNANDRVETIAVSDSTVYAGGRFTSIGGQSRNRIAAIDVATGNATAWNPNASNWVNSIAILDSTVYAGGEFTNIGGQSRNYIATIDTATGNATAWNPNANGGVGAITVSDSIVYVGGGFTNIGGQSRNRIAAFAATTGNIAAWNPNANNTVRAITVSDSVVYVGGGFTNIGGQSRNRIAAIHATTGNATAWNPNTNKQVYSIAVSDSIVYAGGLFEYVGGLSRNHIVAINDSTGNATAWNPILNNQWVEVITVSGDNVIIGGNFTTVDGQNRKGMAAFAPPCIPTSGSQTETVCSSYTWPANSTTYTSSGVYATTLTNAGGCDSVVTLNLTINSSNTGSQSEVACDSYTWPANSTSYTSTGTYTTTLTNAANCDSVVTLNLTVNSSTTGSQTEVACDTYTWPANSTTYTSSGLYTTTLTNAANCDSVVTLNLTVNSSTTESQTEVACDSYTWPANSTTYTSSGLYTTTLTNAANCDSVITLNLSINNNTSSQTEVACDSYTWPANSITYTATGTYTATLTNAANCDSVVTLNLTINSSNTGSQSEVACDSYTWPANSTTYTSTGTYTTTLTNAANCDSVVTLNLTINSSNTGSQTEVACDSYTWPANSTTYTSSGTYTTTLTNAANCDSVVSLNLTINSSNTGSQSEVACDSYTWPANSSTYTSSGIYTATLTNAENCDSVVTLNLTINSNTGSQTEVACDSYTWPANFTTYTSSGTYTTTLTNAANCDSVITLNLTINSSNTGSQTEVACDSYTWPANNQTYTSSGIYTTILTNTANCDSVVTLNLTINTSTSSAQVQTACDSYTWPANSTTYTSSGMYTTTLTNAANCDSVITLNLTINNNTGSQTEVACDSYTWPANAQTYTSTGIYTTTLTNAFGCDSIVTLNLSINNNMSTHTEVTCDSFTWSANATTYTSSGTYTTTLTNAANCDSVVTLNLTINSSNTGTQTEVACDTYTWPANNQTYTSTGTYTTTLTNAANCDSVVTLNLTINSSNTGSQSEVACDSYTWPANSVTYTTSGTYTTTLTNAYNCDSVVTLNLTINNNTGSQTEVTCDSYTWPANGQSYTSSGTYSTTLTNAANCDSVVTLNLTVNSSNSGIQTEVACDSYTWLANSLTYTSTGVYTTTLTNAVNCDSVVTLNLTINSSNTGSQTEVACDSYTWPANSQTYTSSGTYTTTLTNAANCDSVVTLNLTINSSNTGSQTETVCDSYAWPANSTTYTSSGTYTTTLTNAANCDSVVTLNLTINSSNTGTQTEVACDSYTWPANSLTYTSTGVYTTTLTNAANCDSVVTLNLTINSSNTGTQTEVACDSYTWPANSLTYTSTGVYTTTLTNAANCDSVVTLNLTINSSNTGSQTEIACDSYTWPANSTTYTSSGTYTTTLTNAANCDSVVTLNLTINSSSAGSQTETACDSYTWPANSQTYTSTGIYLDTLSNVNGCDSIATLDLTINYSDSTEIIETACGSYTWAVDSNVYTQSGIYTSTLNTANGCDSIVWLDLKINNVDTSLLVSGSSITATATEATFQWLDCINNYSTISGETDSVFIAAANGEYAVEITDLNCIDTSRCVVINSVGISAFSSSFEPIIYPNPTLSNVIIDFKQTISEGSIAILDAYGKQVVTEKFKQTLLVEMKTNRLAAGIYFIRIDAGEVGTRTYRLMKQ